jgi:hypothetical protein
LPHLERSYRKFIAGSIAALIAIAIAGAARAESLLEAGSIDYNIMSADGRVTMGHGRYTIDRGKDGIILHGESRYTTGEYDVETDLLSPGFSGSLPRLKRFDHLFYSAEGSLIRVAHADLSTGTANCVDSPEHIEQSDTLDFPPDTWAGASVLIPIQEFLRSGGEGELHMNVFNCTWKPGVFAVTVNVAPRSGAWPYAQRDAVQVNVKPHFGWYDVFIEPFVPKLHAWFDPRAGWGFEGVAIARYYRGPDILIVSDTTRSGGATQVLIPGAKGKRDGTAEEPRR